MILSNFINPEQSTIAISEYDDAYMAQRFIEYFKLLSKDATIPKLMEEMTASTTHSMD